MTTLPPAASAPADALLTTLAASAVLAVELERPLAGSTEKHGAAEAKIKRALRELYAAYETAFGDQPPWVDFIALDLVLPLISEAVKRAVAHFNAIGLFKGRPKP